jgi:hypothetical protein
MHVSGKQQKAKGGRKGGFEATIFVYRIDFTSLLFGKWCRLRDSNT